VSGIFTLFPWERQRYLRKTDYLFQIQSFFAEKAEKIVFHGEGDIDGFYKFFQAFHDSEGMGILLWKWPDGGMNYGNFVSLSSAYQPELTRRAMILQLALIKYAQENGSLPETLEELKTSGILAEIPTVPYTGLPFFYDPQPDGTEGNGNADLSQSPRHSLGTPYLWTDNFGGTRTKPDPLESWPYSGNWFDLNYRWRL
jgi:hypothetical protein